MGLRARDHGRVEMFNAKCAKCGTMTRVPWDPRTDTQGRVPMCRDCRSFYAPYTPPGAAEGDRDGPRPR